MEFKTVETLDIYMKHSSDFNMLNFETSFKCWFVFITFWQHDINVEVFDYKDIEYGPLLGKGGEGEVHKCTVVYNEVPVDAAAKTLLDNSDDAISFMLEEIELLWWVGGTLC